MSIVNPRVQENDALSARAPSKLRDKFIMPGDACQNRGLNYQTL
jgi:hypothetical protein